MPQMKCQLCGAEFYANRKRIERGAGKFCSRKCKGIAQSGENSPVFKKSKRICKTCGTEFLSQPAQIRNGGGIYCSRKCFTLDRKTPSRECENCHKAFNVFERSKQRFCSISCRSEWMKLNRKSKKIERRCQICEKSFSVIPAVAKNGLGIVCSWECFKVWASETRVGENNPKWRGGCRKYYGPNWVKQRRAARKRDNYTCQRCGRTQEQLGKSLDVHHIIRFNDFDNYEDANKLSNLISLCPKCHTYVEHNGIDF